MSSVIDQFFVALGFKADTSDLKKMQKDAAQAKESMLSLGNALAGIAVGFAIKEVAALGSAWESNRIQIAGYFDALGQSSNFNEGLKDADEALNLITIAAAKLPGEAEEYQEVFKDTFTFVKGAVGGSIKQMVDFTDTLTAIGKAGKIDAAQIGRETNELLAAGQGRAMGRNRLWMQLFPLMRRLEGQAHLTKEAFNAMTESKRADLMQRAFKGLQPMLDASANSFDAMWGAMVSGVKILVRLGTSGIFEGMKDGLNKLNAVFFDSEGKITSFGQSIVDNTKAIGHWITTIVTDGAQVVGWIGSFSATGTILKGVLIALMPLLAGLATEKLIGKILKLSSSVLTATNSIKYLKLALTGGVLMALGLIIEDLYQFFTGGKSVIGMLTEKWAPAIYVVIASLGALGAAFIAFQVLSMPVFTGLALAMGGAFAPIFGATLLVLGLVAALAILAKKIPEITHYWDEFKVMLKIPGAKVKDLISGGGEHYEDQVRAEMGASREKVDATDARARSTAAPTFGPSMDAGDSRWPKAGAAPAVWEKWDPSRGGTASSPTVVDNSTHIATLNVHANNPAELHRELAKQHKRVIRSGQSPVGL